jgi:hypothetical protein
VSTTGRFWVSPEAIASLPVAAMAEPPSAGSSFFTAELPPTEMSTEPTVIMFRVADDKISSIEVPVPEELWDRAVAMVSKKGPRFHADIQEHRIVEAP